LDEERQAVNDRLRHLHAQLAALKEAATPTVESSTLSPDEKSALFRALFRGREDVYPKLWVSQKGDRKGYMPACANDGNYTLCGKRKNSPYQVQRLCTSGVHSGQQRGNPRTSPGKAENRRHSPTRRSSNFFQRSEESRCWPTWMESRQVSSCRLFLPMLT